MHVKDSGFRHSQTLKSDTLPLLSPSACQAAHASCCFGPGPCLVPRRAHRVGKQGFVVESPGWSCPKGYLSLPPPSLLYPWPERKWSSWPHGEAGRRVAAVLLALVMRAWPSSSHPLPPPPPGAGLVSAPETTRLVSTLGSGSLCVPPPPMSAPQNRAGQVVWLQRTETGSSLLKPKMDLSGDSWGASRPDGAAGCAGLRRVLVWELLARSQRAAPHPGQSLRHPVTRRSHSGFNSPMR